MPILILIAILAFISLVYTLLARIDRETVQSADRIILKTSYHTDAANGPHIPATSSQRGAASASLLKFNPTIIK